MTRRFDDFGGLSQDGTYRQWMRWRSCHAVASRVAWEMDDNHPDLVPFARLDERGGMSERMNYYVRPPTSELIRCFPAILLPGKPRLWRNFARLLSIRICANVDSLALMKRLS